MAAIAPVVDRLEDVPEPARGFYVQRDGKFHIDLSGAPAGFVPAADLATANGKVVEFRDTNIALRKSVDELTPLKEKFAGIDPDAAKTALAKVAELEKKGVKDPGDVAKLVTDGIAAALQPVQAQLAQITNIAQANEKKNQQLLLRTSLSDKFIKVGGVPDALDFVVSKAEGVFIVEDGVVKAAKNQFSADRPGEPLSIDEWMTRMTKDASFAFKQSGGGGAAPANGLPAARAGVVTLTDPTPQQLGEHAAAILKGTTVVHYTENK